MRGMSSDPEFEKRINNKLETIVENQARFDEKMAVMQEAIAGLIQVARLHDGQHDDHRQQLEDHRRQFEDHQRQMENHRQQMDHIGQVIATLAEQGKEQWERINALIRIVEGHLTNHP